MVKGMLKKNIDLKIISEIANISLKEVQSIKTSLNEEK